MNKILREEMEYLITCNDKAITPDVKDDVSLTLQYIDELENKIDKAIEYIEELISDTKGIIDGNNYKDKEETVKIYIEDLKDDINHYEYVINVLRGEDNE